MSKKKILIIEDDSKLRLEIINTLEGYDYQMVMVEDFHKVEETFSQEQADLVLLDINLPYYDGNYYCRMFRRKSNCPIIIISAGNSDSDQVLSMELGADDYITKPFSTQVLIAKVNAVMRRNYGEYAKKEQPILTVEGLSLDESCFKLTFQDKSEELSKNEFKLMKKLMQEYQKLVPREVLLEEIWDDSCFVDDNTLTVNVTRLKGKLANLGIMDAIKTKRGVGYLFEL
jgi:Response regulators consisting of a CheY-like receiver domain and a winged-helix DNA-binding domain